MDIKYLPKENADYLYKLLEIIKLKQPNILFVVTDEDYEPVYEGNNIEKCIEEIDGIDSNFHIDCFIGEKLLQKRLGWFFITPWEERDCLVCDYIDNDFCNECIECLKEDE